MKITAQKQTIAAGLSRLQNVIGKATTLPILGNVLIECADGQATLTATDLCTIVKTSVPCEIGEPGETTIPGRKLFAIVKELAGETVVISTDEKDVTEVVCASSRFKVRGLPKSEFPQNGMAKFEKLAELNQAELAKALRQTAFASSTDESRHVLNGVYFGFNESGLSLVATDGRRLAIAPTGQTGGKKRDFILPSDAAGELVSNLSDGDMIVTCSENQVRFELGATTVTSKLIEGNFPNYQQVIPASKKHCVLINREELIGAISRAAIMVSEKFNSIKLAFAKDGLTITANSPDVGESREFVPVKFKGELAIAFAPDYLLAGLKKIDADEIEFELTDELSPGVICSGEYRYIVMPMRIS